MAATKQVKKPRKAPRRKVAAGSKGLAAADTKPATNEGVEALVAAIGADGGSVIGTYQDPLGGTPVVVAALPIDKVEPTPFQRDRSEAHTKKLADAMERVGRFLDPVICVRKDGVYWTPNGNHRLGAMRLLGMKTIVALVLPDPDVAYKILALNTEKAHNLKERSLEVIRMVRGLAADRPGTEADFLAVFEEPHFITLGAAYEKRPRFSAGAFAPVVKRLEGFLPEPLPEALKIREARADLLLAWEDEVNQVVEALKAKGLQSPYLKAFVVAKVNFLRFKKGGDFDFDEVIGQMREATRKIDPAKVDKAALAAVGGAPSDGAEE